ncbi:Cell wall alpha-1,3-glucan synthase ags1 [Cytospora paraplurivora]|uniref:alpha-1,3-glucan synthase n=1 Tax=Cytospora paraplurivora TaxID=2898453 RepID=A0AAN9UDB0_9PEZI
MFVPEALLLLLSTLIPAQALRYDPDFVDWNLNTNEDATNPLDYSGKWEDHDFQASPDNWRFPFYTLFLDRFVNGDPTNDNANGSVYEQEVMGTQLRFGGDIQGLVDTLDYIQGIGIRGLYIAGSPFINQPYAADSYSPLDLTLLDQHFGNITAWRQAIDEIHKRGMYVVLDNTVATMGDLIGFHGYLNVSAPFVPEHEHTALWKTSRQYHDFNFGTEFNDTCENFPRFYFENGSEAGNAVYDTFGGCYNGDFDQFGDTEAFGVYDDYRRQVTKFASVQDRLREWVPDVMERISLFSCLTIQMLDVDGFRYDKATQVTVDAEAKFSSNIRKCASDVGKKNFFIPGKSLVATHLVPSTSVVAACQTNPEKVVNLTTKKAADLDIFIRDEGMSALDSAAFHYSIYRNLLRFLGMDGSMEAGYDLPKNWVEAWALMLETNDFLNAQTGAFDPRHMYGVVNQDVFRWPAITYGVERNLLGLFITTLHMPGIPLLLWGEEQAFYVLDNTASNYMFGRQPISGGPAWEAHGCYSLSGELYYHMPLNASRKGCEDPTVSWDHRDPSHPVRNIIKHMYHLRNQYPVLTDGFYLLQLSNHTEQVFLPGSSGVDTETGLWSTMRSSFLGVQDLDDETPVWLLYHNRNTSYSYTFDCSGDDALISPFPTGTTVKNLFFPHQTINLTDSNQKLGINGSTKYNGCTKSLDMGAFEFRAFVPEDLWVPPPPMITKFYPGHDYRIQTTEENNTLSVEFRSNVELDCDSFTEAINFTSITDSDLTPSILGTPICRNITYNDQPDYSGALISAWSWSANITGLAHGIHQIIINNATTSDMGSTTNSVDRFMVRVGSTDNPLVFPTSANYSSTLLTKDNSGAFTLSHTAPGATYFRYSTNWGSSYSGWLPYSRTSSIEKLAWSGTKKQEWEGEHVIVQYWSQLLGSSSYVQEGDANWNGGDRRFPHIFTSGPFNEYGYDAGVQNEMKLFSPSYWQWHYMDEWPAKIQLSVWGINPDNQPDQSFVYGDIDADGVLDRLPPSSLVESDINITHAPVKPYLAYRLVVQDSTHKYGLIPVGNMHQQLILYVLLWVVPLIMGILAVEAFKRSFYKIKFNEIGVAQPSGFTLLVNKAKDTFMSATGKSTEKSIIAGMPVAGGEKRKQVLIATMEYNIDDWNIKIKIGGLGVMAQLMGTALKHQDLVWVVPCVGGIDYPVDTPAEPMYVKIMGQFYEIQVQYHKLDNITFVLLDAPVFRKQTKAEPYPPRMDDMESAIYYSAWNQCIAETTNRFPIDLYHINDYHGACAPLYLLPRTIPVALSLHNAEFQGMWPMRTPEESKEVAEVFNLPMDIVKEYVQFGSVFNLLHAGASYLRVHQKGFGAVGVSKKYGDRSFARYPIFWGLSKVGQLPNPDPTDTAEWSKEALVNDKSVTVDKEFEASRGELRRQAQEWAGLEQDPNAELFVFVGRWSLQKGVDLIADIFPWVLEQYPQAQLICIGPVIDLYGKFAALKLAKLMDMYPKRVCSKPQFTALPPYIFSGAEFALIPSRDEPFGLVAVEFGRKGALGVGARVGGLGQMPGWWYTVESTKVGHAPHAILAAMKSDIDTRAVMRARSAKQRFPVAEWLQRLDKLQRNVIKVHNKEAKKATKKSFLSSTRFLLGGNPSKEALNSEIQLQERMPEWMMDLPDYDEDDPHASRFHTVLSSPEQSRPGTPGIDSATPSMPGTPLPWAPGHSHLDSDTPSLTPSLMSPTRPFALGMQQNASRASMLSMVEVVGDRHDYKLQQTDPFFTDSRGSFYSAFEKKLGSLDADNSISDLCIEDYLIKSEKNWFNEFRDTKLGRGRGRNRSSSPSSRDRSGSRFNNGSKIALSLGQEHRPSTLVNSVSLDDDDKTSSEEEDYERQFELPTDYIPPSGLKKYLQYQIGEWPIYTILLSLSQVIASNSYQITLLTGTVGQTATKLYVVASIYLGSTIIWYILSRTVALKFPISIPFFFYGCAFVILGCSPFGYNDTVRGWLQNVATGFYAFASSSGGLTFAFNFGTDGGSTISTWIMRMAIIQGICQMYTVALWSWGSAITAATANSETGAYSLANSPYLLAVCIPIAVGLWVVGVVLFLGLPDFYNETPGPVPQLWKTLLKRKTIAWYLLAIIIQNYFLSSIYGRNWAFLFSSSVLQTWHVILLALGFFVVMWCIVLLILGRFSKSHPWMFPIFSVGLGAPRWAQMFWGCSRIGLWLPWAGSAVAGALVSRLLWLWLGLLDGIQGAGIGMILMLTLTRVHVAAAIVAAQVLGSIATIAGRASAPDKVGPGRVFPDLSEGAHNVIGSAWFWVVLCLNLGLCVGYFKFFRKEQVSKP